MPNGNTVTWKVVACSFGTIIMLLLVGSIGYILNDLQTNDQEMAKNLNALIITVNRLAQSVEDADFRNDEDHADFEKLLEENRKALRELERKIGP